MQEVFIKMVPRGILPALHVGNFWLKKTGILESKDGSVCLKCSIPHISIRGSAMFGVVQDFKVLSEISCACTSQDCFQLLCTSILEVILFGKVFWVTRHKYVFPFNCQQREFHHLISPLLVPPAHSLTHAGKFGYS
jgi:hypothetical protein